MVRQRLAEVAALRAENADLKAKLDAALRHRFGRRSERRTPTPKPKDRPPPRRDDHGRSPLPAHLERRDVVHDRTEAQKPCPCRGRVRACIGHQTAEQLDRDPARFFVRRTIRKTYARAHCEPAPGDPTLDAPTPSLVVTAGPPRVGPIPKGVCGPGLLAHAVTAKFADHTPVHRLAGQLARSGATVPTSTLGNWLAGAADLLSPLVRLMHRRVLLSRVVHADDTGVKLRVPGSPRTAKAHLWVGIGDADFPYVVFDFTADHTAAGPTRFPAGYPGYFQADALAQYEGRYAGGRIQRVCCAAHARRQFVAAGDAGDARATAGRDRFGRLYAVERALPPRRPPSDDPGKRDERRPRGEERRRLRPRDAGPVWAELAAWLAEHKPGRCRSRPWAVPSGTRRTTGTR